MNEYHLLIYKVGNCGLEGLGGSSGTKEPVSGGGWGGPRTSELPHGGNKVEMAEPNFVLGCWGFFSQLRAPRNPGGTRLDSAFLKSDCETQSLVLQLTGRVTLSPLCFSLLFGKTQIVTEPDLKRSLRDQ